MKISKFRTTNKNEIEPPIYKILKYNKLELYWCRQNDDLYERSSRIDTNNEDETIYLFSLRRK